MGRYCRSAAVHVIWEVGARVLLIGWHLVDARKNMKITSDGDNYETI